MSTSAIVALTIFGTFGVGMAALLLVRWLQKVTSERAQRLSGIEKVLTELTPMLAKAIEQIAKNGETAEKLLQGHIEVTKEQVLMLAKVEEAVESFRDMCFGGSRDRKGYIPPDDHKADREAEILERMERGMSREDAEGAVSETRLWSSIGRARGGG